MVRMPDPMSHRNVAELSTEVLEAVEQPAGFLADARERQPIGMLFNAVGAATAISRPSGAIRLIEVIGSREDGR